MEDKILKSVSCEDVRVKFQLMYLMGMNQVCFL